MLSAQTHVTRTGNVVGASHGCAVALSPAQFCSHELEKVCKFAFVAGILVGEI
jgi:hypothetical protein